MVRSRCSAIAAIATGRDVVGPGNAAGNATGLAVVAARVHADAGSGSSAVAANRRDSGWRAVPAPVASCVDASCSRYRGGRYHADRCRDDRSNFDRVPTADDVAAPLVAVAGVDAATPNRGSAAV